MFETQQQKPQQEHLTQSAFEECFPELEIVPLSGDGVSCQFEAVAESACGTSSVSGLLRKKAVEQLRSKWGEVGSFVLAEVAHQAQVPEGSLDADQCCEFLLGSNNRVPLWGNHCTLAQLPSIVDKTIVVLTISQGRPFKHVFNCEKADGTIHIGFLPEYHYFPLKTKSRPAQLLKKGDKGFLCLQLLAFVILIRSLRRKLQAQG